MENGNAKFEVKGDLLTITVDLSKVGPESKSGKSRIIASTGGNIDVPGRPDCKIGLNIYKPLSRL